MKELKAMGSEERKKKISELKLELVKSRVDASKTGGARVKEVRKAIARILTLEKMNPSKAKPKEVKLSERKISKDKS